MVWKLGKLQRAYNELRFDVGTVLALHKPFVFRLLIFKHRCLDNYFFSFRSLFESISIDYVQNTAALKLNYFVFETFYLLPF